MDCEGLLLLRGKTKRERGREEERERERECGDAGRERSGIYV